MLIASFFDVNDNGLDITDVAVILAVIASVITGAHASFRWTRRQLREEIREVVCDEIAHATKAIQPNANGGRSLPDANKKLDLVIEHLGINLPESLRVKDLPKP